MRNGSGSGMFPFVVSVALARPLWWLALRTIRHLTGVATAAIMLAGGAGGGFSAGQAAARPPALFAAQSGNPFASASPIDARTGDVLRRAPLSGLQLRGVRLPDRLVAAPAADPAGPEPAGAAVLTRGVARDGVRDGLVSPGSAWRTPALPADRRGSAVGRRAPPVA